MSDDINLLNVYTLHKNFKDILKFLKFFDAVSWIGITFII